MIARVVFALAAGFSAIGDNDDPATPIVWPSPEVTIRIGSAGSDDVSDNSDLIAIRSALTAWSTPACTNLRLIDGGTTASPDDSDDGVNTIYFRESNWPGGLSGAAAVTVHHENSGTPDTWRDADIVLNGQDLEWSTTAEPQRYDIQSVVTHELGHLIGLKHAANLQATMYFVSPRGNTQRRTLHAADVAAVCWLYPAAGMRRCADDDECPMMITPNGSRLRLACTNDQCVPGDVTYGGECFGGGDCASGTCTADPDTSAGDDPGFCTQSCASAACPNGDFCQADSCFLGRDDCVADADCNMNNVVCAIDLDGRRRCSKLCIRDANCANNEVCHGGTGANPPGFCRTPGAGGNGAPCSDGYDCASLYCAGTGIETTCLGTEVPPEDAGVLDDAGVSAEDANMIERDAIAETDGPRDMRDGGVRPNADASGEEGDAGVGPEMIEGSGCGCTSTSTSTSELFVFALLLMLMRARDRSP